MSRRTPPPPLDAAALERLALRYVERFATSRGRLADYLARKVRERGWAEATPPDAAGIADRMAERGYVDDAGFAGARAGAMARRGLGARRIVADWRAAGIDEATRAALSGEVAAGARSSALAFARRRRLGPWAAEADRADPRARTRAMGAMLRAGHDVDLARRVLALALDEVDAFGNDG